MASGARGTARPFRMSCIGSKRSDKKGNEELQKAAFLPGFRSTNEYDEYDRCGFYYERFQECSNKYGTGSEALSIAREVLVFNHNAVWDGTSFSILIPYKNIQQILNDNVIG